MQHTKQYELNLIDKTDAFSPDPLNENTEKVEKALEAVRAGAADEAAARAKAVSDEATARAKADADEAAARSAADKALDQRVTVLEAHKIVTGFTSSSNGIERLGFTPTLIIAMNGNNLAVVTSGFTSYDGIYIVDGGFYHDGYFSSCNYIAFV